MSNLISKCGINCGTCPWGPFPRKEIASEEFVQYRKDAKRILGYMPIKTPCLTCQTPEIGIPKQSKLPNRKCLIRQCVDKTRIENCAYCSRFPCDTAKATAGAWNRESIETRLGMIISEEEYSQFVEPFEGIKRLKAIQDSLMSEEIKEPAKAPKSKIKIVEFPENLCPKEKIASFRAIHKLLDSLNNSSFDFRDSDTFAQYHKLENQRVHIFRFLWILGKHGKVRNEKYIHLEVDAETYLANRGKEKTLAIWSFVEDIVFKTLSEFKIYCTRLILKGLKKEDLVTGTGYLRKKGWVIKMAFEKKSRNISPIEALQIYIRKLEKKYGTRAFQRFRNVDMQVLSKT